jgi:hypothetical protein
MSKRIAPYFGGLWTVYGEPPDERHLRTAMQFFGENYMVFLDFEKPNRIIQSMHHYVLDERTMTMQQLDAESKEELPIVEVKWRLLENGLLEFIEGKKFSLWEAVSVDKLVSEGYPRQLFDSLRGAFLDLGSFYIDAGLVPDKSVFTAARKDIGAGN